MYNFKNKYTCKFFLRFITSAFFILISSDLFCLKELRLEFGKNDSGELSVPFLEYIKNVFNINTFIETGTYMGFSAANAAQVFDQVETVELSEEFYQAAKAYLSSYKNLTVYHGDSALMLSAMIKASKGNILFWLDGHYSANGTALGDINTPIVQELKRIKESGLKNAVIMIDDIRLFDKYINTIQDLDLGGYPTIPEIYPLLLDINPNYDVVVMGDILIAYEKSEDIIVSKTLRACSVTRTNLNLSKEELDDAEITIGNAKGQELSTIFHLYYIYCGQEHFTKYGIGAHYSLWYIYWLMQNRYWTESLQQLRGPINFGMDPNHIKELINTVNNRMADTDLR